MTPNHLRNERAVTESDAQVRDIPDVVRAQTHKIIRGDLCDDFANLDVFVIALLRLHDFLHGAGYVGDELHLTIRGVLVLICVQVIRKEDAIFIRNPVLELVVAVPLPYIKCEVGVVVRDLELFPRHWARHVSIEHTHTNR